MDLPTVLCQPTKNKHLYRITLSYIDILKHIIELFPKEKKLNVLNIGGGYEKECESFLLNHPRINYYCLDIQPPKRSSSIQGDITDETLSIQQTFDIIYTKDTFEHILNPWDATKNIKTLLNENGIFICIVPFSWRYHACPVDCYRYSHTGLRYIFERLNDIECICTGYIKHKAPNGGWYKSKTDVTLDGLPFQESISTVYISKKNTGFKFTKDLLDVDKEAH